MYVNTYITCKAGLGLSKTEKEKFGQHVRSAY